MIESMQSIVSRAIYYGWVFLKKKSLGFSQIFLHKRHIKKVEQIGKMSILEW